MSAETFVVGSAAQLGRLVLLLRRMTFERPWKVTLERVEPRRSIPQNDKLRAMERQIAEHCGYAVDELHEILLAARFGTKEIRFRSGVLMERPARRSSELTRQEMADYITWVQAFAAQHLGMELM